MSKEYALYKGDDLLHIGTIDEIAQSENVRPKTIKFYMTPSYINRYAPKSYENRRVLVSLDDL